MSSCVCVSAGDVCVNVPVCVPMCVCACVCVHVCACVCVCVCLLLPLNFTDSLVFLSHPLKQQILDSG